MILLGWLGLGILILAYIILLFSKSMKYFFLIDSIASAILTVHAILIKDIPFIVVNSFITIVLLYKYKGEKHV